MNPDRLQPGQRCASTSNRNFEGRQGAGGRTHLVSPVMAAAAAIAGHLTDVRSMVIKAETMERLDAKDFVNEAGGIPASPLAQDVPKEVLSSGSAGVADPNSSPN